MTKSVGHILIVGSMSLLQTDTVGQGPREPPLKKVPLEPIAIATSLVILLLLATILSILMLPLRRSMGMYQAHTSVLPRLHLEENAILVYELLHLPLSQRRRSCQVDNERLCPPFWKTLIRKLQSLFLQVLMTGLLSWKLVSTKCIKTLHMKGLHAKSWSQELRIWKNLEGLLLRPQPPPPPEFSNFFNNGGEGKGDFPSSSTICTSCWF